jgi:hypothetical protein
MIQKHTVDDDSICGVDDKSLSVVVQLNQYQTQTQMQMQHQQQQQQQQRPRLARIWLFLLGTVVVATHQRLLLPNAYPAVHVSATSTMVRMGNGDSNGGWFDPRFPAQHQRGRGRGRRHRWNVATEEPSQRHIHPILTYRSAISNSNVRVVQLASSKTALAKKKTTTRTTATTSKNNDFLLKNHQSTDLTFFGKVVAGSVEIVTSVVFDYCMGYVSGYVVGTVLGIPRSIFGSFSSSAAAKQRNLWERMHHLHSQSHNQYGRRWGNVLSVFGGCRTTVRILRSSSRNSSTIRNSHTEQHQPPSSPPDDDEWNEILSSILAGALLSRSVT